MRGGQGGILRPSLSKWQAEHGGICHPLIPAPLHPIHNLSCIAPQASPSHLISLHGTPLNPSDLISCSCGAPLTPLPGAMCRPGRKSALALALLVSGAGSLACAASPSYWLFFAARTVTGVGVAGIGLVGYVLGCEFVGPTWRGILVTPPSHLGSPSLPSFLPT